ncbi:hypothetical protein DCO44_14070 [Acinetobacter sp. AM]|nr:hypothetical protein DCO44_14070 [Acinetobacter sp. AM]
MAFFKFKTTIQTNSTKLLDPIQRFEFKSPDLNSYAHAFNFKKMNLNIQLTFKFILFVLNLLFNFKNKF